MILLIGGEKGGTGKTTIATNLAVQRTKFSKEVLLIDSDKQMTATYWCSVREENGVEPRITSVQKYGKSLKTEAEILSEKYQDIIIDAGGRDAPELRAALLVADMVVIPLRPSQFDLWTLSKINDLVEEVSALNEKLQAFVLLNQSSAHPSVKESEEAKELLLDFDNLKLMKSILCERIAFRKAAIKGESVIEASPLDEKAAKEMDSVYREIYSI